MKKFKISSLVTEIILSISVMMLVMSLLFTQNRLSKTQKELGRIQSILLTNSSNITELKNREGGIDIRLLELEDKIEGTERWIWDFNNFMFGESDK